VTAHDGAAKLRAGADHSAAGPAGLKAYLGQARYVSTHGLDVAAAALTRPADIGRGRVSSRNTECKCARQDKSDGAEIHTDATGHEISFARKRSNWNDKSPANGVTCTRWPGQLFT
jgi:hypothetical protein